MNEKPVSPSSIAEQAIIGCVLIDNDTLAIAREIVKPDDFFSKCNQMIFSSMCASEDSGKQITVASLLVDLMNEPSFNEAGGISYLTNCSSECIYFFFTRTLLHQRIKNGELPFKRYIVKF